MSDLNVACARGLQMVVDVWGAFVRYLPEYGFLARAHDAALADGTPSGL